MQCEQAREQFSALLRADEGVQWPEALSRHLRGCQDCRAELNGIQETWRLLGQWPEAEPAPGVGTRVASQVRRQLLRESVLTVSGWTRAVLAAVVGVGVSLGLSLLVPYSLLISLCQQALQVSDPHTVPYLLAGMAYGVPLALGVWILRGQALSGVIGSLEASALFLVILAPYVIAQCREFAPPFQAAFVSGLAGGAVVSSLVGLWLARLVSFGRIQA